MVAELGGSLPFQPPPLVSGAQRSAESLARTLETRPNEAAARKFESLFASMLVKEMRKALPDGFFGSGSDGDIYGGWFDEHLGAALARDDGLHLRPVVETALARKAAAQAYTAGASAAGDPAADKGSVLP
jgi:Rod binding domain-containing protein